MATITKIVTLTEKNDSGPLYDLFWSVDNITFTSSEDSRNLYLPFVGSTATANVDSSATAFRLQSKGVCTNFVSSGSFGPTPTPTPTSAAIVTGMVLYEYIINSGPATSASYVDFNGNTQYIDGYTFGSAYRFAAQSGSFNPGNTTSTTGLQVLDEDFTVYFQTLEITKVNNNLTAYTVQMNNGSSPYVSDTSGPYTQYRCIVSGSQWETYDPTGAMTLTLSPTYCLAPTPTPTTSPTPTPTPGGPTPTPIPPTPTPSPTATPAWISVGSHTIVKAATNQHKSVWLGSSNMYQASLLVTYLTGQSSPATSTPYSLSNTNYKIYDQTNTERGSWVSIGGTAMYYFDGIQSVVLVSNITISGSYVNGSSSATDVWQYSKL